MKQQFKPLLAMALAPFALMLAGCESETDGIEAGEPIAAIPAPDGQSWTDVVNVSAEGGYVLGNPDAPLKLVEYASHTCPACAAFAQTGKPELAQYIETGVVSFELRNLVRDPIDLTIATLVRCGAPENMQPLADQAWAELQTTFERMQSGNAELQLAAELPAEARFIEFARITGLTDFFAARGLSADQQRSCLSDTAVIEAIADNSATQADELNIQATPSFLLNGRNLNVSQWPDLEPLLQRAGARQE